MLSLCYISLHFVHYQAISDGMFWYWHFSPDSGSTGSEVRHNYALADVNRSSPSLYCASKGKNCDDSHQVIVKLC